MPNKNAPIGVFDSGLGGLTAVRELRRILPHEDIVFFGDTGRVPYGTRGTETIIRYAQQDIAFLLKNNVKALVAACGTISSTLPTEVSSALPVPYMGVVESTAAAAAAATKNKRVGILGTSATIRSGSFVRALRALDAGITTTATACPLFVSLVENGYFNEDNPVTALVAADYLRSMKDAGVDTIILGCTHFPLIAPIIAREMGPGVTLVDSGRETAKAMHRTLEAQSLLNEDGGDVQYYVSDSPESFGQLSSWFLGEYAGGTVTQISLDELANA